jgi:nitrous oxidase accessory protein
MHQVIEMSTSAQRRPLRHPESRIIAGALVTVCLTLTSPVWARTMVVSPSGPITSISVALRTAGAGDTIEVRPGVYNENIVLDRAVQLVGVGRPLIHGLGRMSVVTVTADHCAVRGFAIEHSGGMLVDEDSGILLKSSNNRIEDNQLSDVLFGIYLLESDHNYISGNTIHGRPLRDLGDRGSGIHIWNSSYNVLEGNTIFETRDGMYLQNAYHSTIRDNRVHNLRYGLHYMYSDDNDFEGNLFYNNVAGAAIMYSKRIRLRHNAFLHNRGFASYGILFQSDDDCVAEENIIADNVVGVFMEALQQSTFRRNLIAGNDTALKVFSSATDNLFEMNNIVENLSPIEVIGSRTNTQWNGPGAGNYWSDYEGFDLNGDGIGDVPYRIQNIFEHLEAEMPMLRLYLFSPAAQSLALAERGFPVLQRDQETDNKPLMRPITVGWEPPNLMNHSPHSVVAKIIPAMLILIALTLFRSGARR